MSDEACTPPTCAWTWPLSGYMEPWQPAHHCIIGIGKPTVAATQSSAQAACAKGFVNRKTSGLRISASSSLFQDGSSSVTYARSKPPGSKQLVSDRTPNQNRTRLTYQWDWYSVVFDA